MLLSSRKSPLQDKSETDTGRFRTVREQSRYLFQDTILFIIWEQFSVLATNLCVGCVPDIVLKNKLVVYDLGKQQIGWVDYDCKFIFRTLVVAFGSKLILEVLILVNVRPLRSGLPSFHWFLCFAVLLC